MNQEKARSILLDHSRSSRNGEFPEGATCSSKMTNPLCGDYVEIQVRLGKGLIDEIGFKADACAICTASASLLSQEVRGLTLTKVKSLSDGFEKMLLNPPESLWSSELMAFQCFDHLRVNPSRKACALLPWIALRSALKHPYEALIC